MLAKTIFPRCCNAWSLTDTVDSQLEVTISLTLHETVAIRNMLITTLYVRCLLGYATRTSGSAPSPLISKHGVHIRSNFLVEAPTSAATLWLTLLGF